MFLFFCFFSAFEVEPGMRSEERALSDKVHHILTKN